MDFTWIRDLPNDIGYFHRMREDCIDWDYIGYPILLSSLTGYTPDQVVTQYL